MTAIAALTAADGQATPVNKTFNVVGVIDGIAKWQDQSGGISIGFPTLTSSTRLPSKGQPNYKIIRKLVLPVLDISSPSTSTGIQPAPSKAFDSFVTVEYVIPERATAAQRADLDALFRNLLNLDIFKENVVSLNHIY